MPAKSLILNTTDPRNVRQLIAAERGDSSPEAALYLTPAQAERFNRYQPERMIIEVIGEGSWLAEIDDEEYEDRCMVYVTLT